MMFIFTLRNEVKGGGGRSNCGCRRSPEEEVEEVDLHLFPK